MQDRDRHHIVHERQEHDLRLESRTIRATPELIPYMDRAVHNELHRACPAIPVIGRIAAFRTLRAFEIEPRDTLQTLDNLCFAVEQSSKSPKAHAIERSVNELVVEALRLQIPYLKEGMVSK